MTKKGIKNEEMTRRGVPQTRQLRAHVNKTKKQNKFIGVHDDDTIQVLILAEYVQTETGKEMERNQYETKTIYM